MPDQLEFRMLQEQMGHILGHIKTTYIAVTAAQSLILIGLWPVCSHITLLFWFFAMQVTGLSQFIVCKKYTDIELTEAQTRFLNRFLIYNALINGVLWGSLTWLLNDTWNIYSLFILLPIAGVVAEAINKAAILPIYFTLVIPILLQTLAVLLFSEASNLLLAAFFTGYYASMIRFSVEQVKSQPFPI